MTNAPGPFWGRCICGNIVTIASKNKVSTQWLLRLFKASIYIEGTGCGGEHWRDEANAILREHGLELEEEK